MYPTPSPADLARFQAIYARRRRRQYLGFLGILGIATLAKLADVSGFGHVGTFVGIGVAAAIFHGMAVAVYWRCPRCHGSFGRRWRWSRRTHCEACGLELEPTPSQRAV